MSETRHRLVLCLALMRNLLQTDDEVDSYLGRERSGKRRGGARRREQETLCSIYQILHSIPYAKSLILVENFVKSSENVRVPF